MYVWLWHGGHANEWLKDKGGGKFVWFVH